MPDPSRSVPVRASLLEQLRRPIPLRSESGTFSKRELRALSQLGWSLLALGLLGAYAAVSEWREHGAVADTIQLTVAATITLASSAWISLLLRKHIRAPRPLHGR